MKLRELFVTSIKWQTGTRIDSGMKKSFPYFFAAVAMHETPCFCAAGGFPIRPKHRLHRRRRTAAGHVKRPGATRITFEVAQSNNAMAARVRKSRRVVRAIYNVAVLRSLKTWRCPKNIYSSVDMPVKRLRWHSKLLSISAHRFR